MLRTGSLSKLLLIRERFLRLVYFKQVPLVHRRQHSTFSCSEIVACCRYWTGQRSTSVTPRRTLSRLTLKEKVSRFHTEIKTKTRQLRQAALAFSWPPTHPTMSLSHVRWQGMRCEKRRAHRVSSMGMSWDLHDIS